MDRVFVIGFTAAVVGGLDSRSARSSAGSVIGLVLSYASGYVGSDLTQLAVLLLLLVVLLLRPSGLFSAARTRQV